MKSQNRVANAGRRLIRTRFAGFVLGTIALAGSVAKLHAQEPTTNSTAVKSVEVAKPFSPTNTAGPCVTEMRSTDGEMIRPARLP